MEKTYEEYFVLKFEKYLEMRLKKFEDGWKYRMRYNNALDETWSEFVGSEEEINEIIDKSVRVVKI